MIKDLTKDINVHLTIVTGTKYLTVSYEKTLFPSILFVKKSYCGIAHE
jgi:DNA polymerase elongation subunit (family B)